MYKINNTNIDKLFPPYENLILEYVMPLFYYCPPQEIRKSDIVKNEQSQKNAWISGNFCILKFMYIR